MKEIGKGDKTMKRIGEWLLANDVKILLTALLIGQVLECLYF